MIRHTATKHVEFKNKPIELLDRKLINLCQQEISIKQRTPVPKKVLRASYQPSSIPGQVIRDLWWIK
jgi:hypothetical protein